MCAYSMCVCLDKWLLCSSDNATAPAEARGYEGERGSCDWFTRYAILSDSESPFTAIAFRCPEGVRRTMAPARIANKACV